VSKPEQIEVNVELKNMKLGATKVIANKIPVVSDEFRGVGYTIYEVKVSGHKVYEFSFDKSGEHLQASTAMSQDEAVKDAKDAILQHLKYD
jgi:hypothetical protein